MALKYSMTLEAIDRISAPAKRMKSSLGGLFSGVRAWGQQVRKVSDDVNTGARSLQHYETRARRLRQVALGSFFRATSMQARQLATSLKAGIRNLNLMELAAKGAKSGLGWMGGKALGMAKWGAAGAGAAGGFALFDLFKTAGQFEQYKIALDVLEGTPAAGKKAMAWIAKFAAETPYELDQVIEAYRNLRAVAGVDPSDGSLRIVGDVAAATSKDIMQVAEAYSDALGFQFERLRDLGVVATQQGDRVTFKYRRNGKAMTETVKKDALAVKRALEGIWSGSYGGATLKQSKSLFGIIANLKDSWSQFLVMIADAGIFQEVKNSLQGWLDKINEMAASGELAIWAKSISDNMSEIWKWVQAIATDRELWRQLGEDAKTFAGALHWAADAIRTLVEYGGKLGFLSDVLKMGMPWTQLPQVIGSAGGPGRANVPRQSDEVWGNALRGGARGSLLNRAPALGPARLQGSSVRKISANDAKVSGNIVVTVKGESGAQPRVASVTSSGPVGLRAVNVGRTMTGAA